MNLYVIVYMQNEMEYIQKVAAYTKERAIGKFRQKMDSAEKDYEIQQVIPVDTGIWV